MSVKSVSIPEWHRLAAEGKAPPVRIKLSGYSMHPYIRGYEDYVTIIPMDRDPVIGDIVMFADPAAKDRYVMHRVWDIQDGKIMTWGDNCKGPDGWLSPEDLWGRAVLIEKGNRKIEPDPQKGMRWARFWHHGRKASHFIQRIRNGIHRRIKKQKA